MISRAVILARIQEKDEQIKSMEESLQAAQDSTSAREKTIEVCAHWCQRIAPYSLIHTLDSLAFAYCRCPGGGGEIFNCNMFRNMFFLIWSVLSQFELYVWSRVLSCRLWSGRWLPCRQRRSSRDGVRRRQQRNRPQPVPMLVPSSKRSRLSKYMTTFTTMSPCIALTDETHNLDLWPTGWLLRTMRSSHFRLSWRQRQRSWARRCSYSYSIRWGWMELSMSHFSNCSIIFGAKEGIRRGGKSLLL